MAKTMDCFVLVDYLRDRYGAFAAEQATEEIIIRNEVQLHSELLIVSKGRPRAVDLVSPNGDRLSIGFHGGLGCAWFTQSSGEPPYQWAVSSAAQPPRRTDDDVDDEEVAISIGGAATGIALRYWLSRDLALAVALRYFRTQRLPDIVQWEIIGDG